jgi:hypothetical protein
MFEQGWAFFFFLSVNGVSVNVFSPFNIQHSPFFPLLNTFDYIQHSPFFPLLTLGKVQHSHSTFNIHCQASFFCIADIQHSTFNIHSQFI